MSRPRLIALLLALATVAVYLPVIRHDFINCDDDVYVTANPMVLQGLTWAGVKWAFTTYHGANWHPLTWLSHMLDCEIFKLNPAGPHLENVLFHAANTALVFLLLWRLTGLIPPSVFVAALFAWHPLHVESVAWVAERKDVLSTFFALLTLLGYAKFAKDNSRRSFWLALLFFALGLLAKPMLVTLPFLLLLLDVWPLNRFRISNFGPHSLSPSGERAGVGFPPKDSRIEPLSHPTCDSPGRWERFSLSAFGRGGGAKWGEGRGEVLFRNLLLEKIPFFALTTVSCVVTFIAQHKGGAVITVEQLPLHYRLENAVVSVAQYLMKTVWPANLSILYPYHPVSTAAILLSLAVLVVISAAVWLARDRNPCWLVGWLWFLGTLVPVIGLVQVGAASMADRYTYIPSIGLFSAVIFGLYQLAGLKKFLHVALVASLVACVIATEKQLSYWRNSETLFRHAVAVTHDNESAYIDLGATLCGENRYPDAEGAYRQALRINPSNYHVHFALGDVLTQLGDPSGALVEYRKSLNLVPNLAAAHTAVGTSLVTQGEFTDALAEFTRAELLSTNDAQPYLEQAKVHFLQGLDTQALADLHTAVRVQPDDFHTLATVAHYLAASTNAAVYDPQGALLLAIKANDLSGNRQPEVFDALGIAFAATGNFTNAITCAQNALESAKAANMNDTVPMQQRLDLYQKNEPWREFFSATNTF